MTPEEQLIEMKKCMEDPVYFYNKYFLIDGKKPPPLNMFQKKYMMVLAKAHRDGSTIVISKPRSGNRLMARVMTEDLNKYFPDAKLIE